VQTLLRYCNVLALIFLISSAITFGSSAYTGQGSMLDAVLVMVDVMTINISSALFVTAGLAATVLYVGATAASHHLLVRASVMSMCVDMGLATVAAILLGSLHALLMQDFKWADVGFTLLEGLTTLRGFDFQQAASAPHSYNVAAWPVQSLVWCLISTKSVYEFDELIVARFPALCDVIISLMVLFGIVLFTVFGPMQASSNIFYANACSVTYRSMEFNLGIHLVFMHQRHPALAAVLRRLVGKAQYFIMLFFATVWWSEVGRPVTHTTQTTCLRLYYRNPCLLDHHAFFVRGCLIAVVLLLATDTAAHAHLDREMRLVQITSSAMVFCWPVCIAVKLVLDVTFGSVVIAASRAVVAVLCVSILLLLSFLYTTLLQPSLIKEIVHRLTRPAPPPDSPDTQPP